MRKHEQQVIEDDLTVAGSNKRSSTSGEETCYSDPIPVDLVINILSRLSLECIARCRCVSKLWSSIIRRPNYNLLFPLKSPATPRLLFVFKVPGELLFNASPQHFNPDRHSSLVATSLQKTTCNTSFFQLCRPVHGLVCCQHGVNSETRIGKVSYSFGYDPIDKQFKVLRITLLPRDSQWWYSEYQVLTLGLGNLSWRKIQCCTPHYILEDYGICINGVLYYPARLNTGKSTMVCFNVRSEKFSFTDIDKDVSIVTYLFVSVIDYNGKLGVCISDHLHNFELWVLENAEEHKWSKHIYKMPHLGVLECAGMIASGEIVLYPRFSAYTRYPFLYFYNLERNIITRVTLQVPIRKQLTYGRFYTFSNFVEDVTLI
ncbi:hypothetical protein ARALYDRAFT_892398 [Arabidopsis lyrata subsp. lyrata]|uniref:F-box domain-containing protein n=1 Tax=Arabidopsis lyrata subsp. lyrata TaxID=81972 RepID=D7KKJ2_ARALL|nr:hypothetical protein ARALYDRAFT_892398 [Arabidopsis lyrata subsp. lyrata]